MTNHIDPMKRFCAGKPHVRKGDHVLIAGAAEADLHTDDVFVAISDPWDLCGTEVVTLDYLESGKRYAPFATKFLAVIPESYRKENKQIACDLRNYADTLAFDDPDEQEEHEQILRRAADLLDGGREAVG